MINEITSKTLQELKDGKAPGIDDIPVAFLKNSGDRTKNRLYKLLHRIYDTGDLLQEFTKSIIPLPMKLDARSSKHYETVSLVSHASSLYLNV